jgi:hypothetical protein
MHWPHGVPPGSRLHVPPSASGMPQWPPSHTRPTQHWLAVVQFDPIGRHVSLPQTLFMHTMVQHALGLAQGEPSSAQSPVPQTLAVQAPLQHVLGSAQGSPFAVHSLLPQVLVVGSQRPSQQSESVPQGPWRGVQPPQTPVIRSQSLSQHSTSEVHAEPSC